MSSSSCSESNADNSSSSELGSMCPTVSFSPSAACNDSETAEGQTGNPYMLAWYIQLVYIVSFVAMVVIAAGGNLIVCWIVLGHKRMRTVTNYFLVNLAVADAMITIFNTSFNFIYVLQSNWPFGKLYCKFSMFIAPCTISASVFTFMAIAIDRYMVIVHPLKPRLRATKVLGIITIIWISSIAVAYPNLPYAVIHTFDYCSGSQRTICYLWWPDGTDSTTDLAYSIFLMLVNYIIPLFALAVTYARVGFELWGAQAIGEWTVGHDETVKSKRKVVKMMVVIVVIFAVCWLPQHAFFVITSFFKDSRDGNQWVQHVYIVIYWLAMSNSMYNPIIYCWMNARFRSGFKYILRWLPCVKWHPSDAAGFWGYTSARNSSTEPTRYSYAPSKRNGTTAIAASSSMHHTFTCTDSSVHGGGQPVCRLNSDGSKGVWVFRNKYSRRRLDSG